ncbi:MAG: CerR family C-terminal domain-containing protein [Candidatus Omnitrophica bacterium]|nr:CerR family C-terminal domain-containing protein [Candidatus Omnitrophota bacterium]
MTDLAHTDKTRERLIGAAGQVFAEQGFRRATIREICRRARANVASVNYYFGDKEKLYSEVLRYGMDATAAAYPTISGLPRGATAEQRLFSFVHSMLLRMLGCSEKPDWHGQLMAREMADPSTAFRGFIGEFARPLTEELEGILREILGKRAKEETVRRCRWSVFGQCMVYQHCRGVVEELDPRQSYDIAEIERIARHITEFSLKAMKPDTEIG